MTSTNSSLSTAPLDRSQQEHLDAFIAQLKRRTLQNTTAIAIQTAELLRSIISRRKFTSVASLIDTLTEIGGTLTRAMPHELTLGNVVRRVLFIVRNEAISINNAEDIRREEDELNSSTDSDRNSKNSSGKGTSPVSRSPVASGISTPSSVGRSVGVFPGVSIISQSIGTNSPSVPSSASSISLSTLLDSQPMQSINETSSFVANGTIDETDKTFSSPNAAKSLHPSSSFTSLSLSNLSLSLLAKLKPMILEEVNILIDEIRQSEVGIVDQSTEHIYAKETILTVGCSPTVIAFLKDAARKFNRQFDVLVAEGAPSYSGHECALKLSSAPYPISTTLIPDSAVFALMPSVNKVIVDGRAVLANGGVLAQCGTQNLAVAASHFSKPFVVLSGLHNLCPLYAFDADTFNEQLPPSQLLKYEDEWTHSVNVCNPAYDYITPDLVTLFITNIGGHNPSYIYRLLAEYYFPDDYDL